MNAEPDLPVLAGEQLRRRWDEVETRGVELAAALERAIQGLEWLACGERVAALRACDDARAWLSVAAREEENDV